jgi:hypothetical protein
VPHYILESLQLMGQRYLFGRQIDLMQATVDLTTTCLTYLCLDPFDPEIGEEDLTENIISGGYRLHAFAASQWVELVRKCAGMLGNKNPPDELITLLEHFITERKNMWYEGLDEHAPECGELETFKREWPELHTLLRHALKFRQLDVGDWRLDEGTSNPFLTIFTYRSRERHHYQ